MELSKDCLHDRGLTALYILILVQNNQEILWLTDEEIVSLLKEKYNIDTNPSEVREAFKFIELPEGDEVRQVPDQYFDGY